MCRAFDRACDAQRAPVQGVEGDAEDLGCRSLFICFIS